MTFKQTDIKKPLTFFYNLGESIELILNFLSTQQSQDEFNF